jgi:hypothetical protein
MRARVTRNAVRICVAESPRFPGQGQSSQGQSDPKTRPKGVVDGRRVNIPVPVRACSCRGGVEKARRAGDQQSRFKPVGRAVGKSAVHMPEKRRRGRFRAEAVDAMLPRKSPRPMHGPSVPQTDTGGRGENPKALERTMVKELSKFAP